MRTLPTVLPTLAASLVSVALSAMGCSSEEAPENQRLRIGSECENPTEVCLETFPPQCYLACADEESPGGDCAISSDGDTAECGADDCVVGYDVETGVETYVCSSCDVAVPLFQTMVNGAVRSTVPTGRPSTRNCTSVIGASPSTVALSVT